MSSCSGCPDHGGKNSLLKTGIVAGLLSSSCCLLQLLLNTLSWWNILHIGCAGFNKVLGPPVRPLLRAMTIGWLGVSWFRGNKKQMLLMTTTITLLIMLLPELLQTLGTHPIVHRTLDEPFTLAYEATFIVDNMGCEACESNVKNILEAHVRLADVDWKTGLVSVRSDQVFLLDTLRERLEYHGYALVEDLNHFTKHMESEAVEPLLFH